MIKELIEGISVGADDAGLSGIRPRRGENAARAIEIVKERRRQSGRPVHPKKMISWMDGNAKKNMLTRWYRSNGGGRHGVLKKKKAPDSCPGPWSFSELLEDDFSCDLYLSGAGGAVRARDG